MTREEKIKKFKKVKINSQAGLDIVVSDSLIFYYVESCEHKPHIQNVIIKALGVMLLYKSNFTFFIPFEQLKSHC